MGREIKRVPLDFDWPVNKVWEGFLSPDRFNEVTCPTCARPALWVGQEPRGDGYTPEARAIADTFYAHMIGGPRADELAWCDKLGQAEVDMLVEKHRCSDGLYDRVELEPPYEVAEEGYQIRFRFDRNDKPNPTAEQVNAQNRRGARGFGHDAINRMYLIRFRCERLGIQVTCPTCDGHGSLEAYPGQRAEAEAWQQTEPPTGDGWQLWETVSEGSPISPVFATAEELAQWLTTPASCWGATKRPMTIEQARGFVGVGWAPSGFINAGGVHDGAEYVGTEKALEEFGGAR